MIVKRQPNLRRFMEIVEHGVPRAKIDEQLTRVPFTSRRNQGWETMRLREGTQ